VVHEPFTVTTPPLRPSRGLDLTAVRELVGADVLARYHRAVGRDARVVVASIETGREVATSPPCPLSARGEGDGGRGPAAAELARAWAARCEALLRALDVHHEGLSRTSEPPHLHVVKAFFLKLFDEGDVCKKACSGRHCPRCAEFLPELAEGTEGEVPCPRCGEATTAAEGEAYFLRASKYHKAVLEHLKEHADFVVPASRREAVLEAAERGVPDVRVSCAAGEGAVEVPFDPEHAIEPAFDALITYLSATGYLADPQTFERQWPPSVQVVAATDLEAHALVWPMVLIAVGLPLPEQLLVRGALRLVSDGGAEETAADAGDPAALAARLGSDALRLAVLHAAAYTDDASLSARQVVEVGNLHLADGVGRLADTALRAIAERRQGAVPRCGTLQEPEAELVEKAGALFEACGAALRGFDFPGALDRVGAVVRDALAYAESNGLTALGGAGGEPSTSLGPGPRRLNTVLYVLAEVCRLVAYSLEPLLPAAAARIESRLGVRYEGVALADRPRWGLMQPHAPIAGTEPLFPRRDLRQERTEQP
jgi:methionyl-tRNA synthetase